MNRPFLEYKEWDSVFFNQSIYSIDQQNLEFLEELTFETLGTALIQVKISAPCIGSIDQLQRKGFFFAESEVSFMRFLEDKKKKNTVLVHALPEDVLQISKMVAGSFKYSRFREPWFHAQDSSRLYVEWSKNAILQQYDDVCLKMLNPESDTIDGVVTSRKLNNDASQIGLICVAEQRQGGNIGSNLLEAIENWSLAQNLRNIYVATQGSNQRACQFYLRNGYQLHTINYWFYKKIKNDSF